MIKPSLRQEINLWRQGYQAVAGLDESGRGPLAGPVVAAAILISPPCLRGEIKRGESEIISIAQKLAGELSVRDSKLLTARQRQMLYEKLINHPQIDWGIGIVSEKMIDQGNIMAATKLAMKKALLDLAIEPEFLLIDGNFLLPNLFINQKTIISGDQKVFSIAAASIIAKVTRDKIMRDLHKIYPQYGFKQHKGYGTKIHFARLAKHGPCQVHRRTFHPVSDLT